jgi:hypothetical protein
VAVAPDTASGAAGHAWALANSVQGGALRHTSDWGGSWAVVGAFSLPYGDDNPYPAIATDAAGRVAICAQGPGDVTPHLWVSVDGGGVTWTNVSPASAGLHVAGVSGLAWDVSVQGRLWVSTGGRSVVAVDVQGGG